MGEVMVWMRQRVVATLRVRSWLLAGVALAIGCSFDSSAIAPVRDEQPPSDDHHDAAQPDAHVVTPVDASAPPPSSTDAQPQAPIRPPPDDPEPDAAPVQEDAASADAAMDAAMDAALDAAVDDDDATVDEPDAAEPCDPPDPGPCVCPHDAPPDDDECGPVLCPLDSCAPDDDCRFVASASSGYYFCNDARSWEQARDRCRAIDDDAHLVSIESDEEDQLVFEEISDKTWLGGNDRDQEGHWHWPGDDTFYDDAEGGELPGAFNNWYDDEPNDIGLSASEPDCLLYWYQNASWADGSCGDPHGYVCEID
jgi:hypothetical protein